MTYTHSDWFSAIIIQIHSTLSLPYSSLLYSCQPTKHGEFNEITFNYKITVYFEILIYFLYWKQIFKCWGVLFKFRGTDTEVLRERSAATSQMTIPVHEWHKTNLEGACLHPD